MKTNTAFPTWLIFIGWILAPGIFLLIGYYIGIFAVSSSAANMSLNRGGLLGLQIGLVVGLCLAGIYTSLAIRTFLPISGIQIFLVAIGWGFSGVVGVVTTAALLYLITLGIKNNIVIAAIPIVPGGLSMGAVGGFITTRVINNLKPDMEKKILVAMIIRWGLGFAVGGLLGSVFLFYGVLRFVLGSLTSPETTGAIAFAIGSAIVGLSGAFIGGRFMLKQLVGPMRIEEDSNQKEGHHEPQFVP